MYLLTRREHCYTELKIKALHRFRDAEPFVVEQVLEYLKGKNYLNERRYAECFTRFRSKKGIGPQKILSELRQKGCQYPRLTEVVYEDEFDWNELLMREASKKLRTIQSRSVADRNIKLTRFLLYRGFDSDAVKDCIAQL